MVIAESTAGFSCSSSSLNTTTLSSSSIQCHHLSHVLPCPSCRSLPSSICHWGWLSGSGCTTIHHHLLWSTVFLDLKLTWWRGKKGVESDICNIGKQINRVHIPAVHWNFQTIMNILSPLWTSYKNWPSQVCATQCTQKVKQLRKTNQILVAPLWECHFSLLIDNYSYLQFIMIITISMKYKDRKQ